jgi:hypothetical protein
VAACTDSFHTSIFWHKHFEDFRAHASERTPVSSVPLERTRDRRRFFFNKETAGILFTSRYIVYAEGTETPGAEF